MQQIVGVTELQRRFRAVFDEVVQKNTPFILTRGSRPEAVLISYQDFMRFQALETNSVLAGFDRLTARLSRQNAAVNEADLAADIEAARSELAD